MKKTIPLFILVALGLSARAQSDDTAEIKKTINSLFDGMRKSDSAIIKSVFAPGAIMQTVVSKNKNISVVNESVDEFASAISKPHPQVYDERIQFKTILVDGNLASVWAPYDFYIGKKRSHGGIDSFQLVKLADGWKITYIIDTRVK